jgi:hypothetical protein
MVCLALVYVSQRQAKPNAMVYVTQVLLGAIIWATFEHLEDIWMMCVWQDRFSSRFRRTVVTVNSKAMLVGSRAFGRIKLFVTRELIGIRQCTCHAG